MYGSGGGVPKIVPAVLGASTTAVVVPHVGANTAAEYAVAAAAGLAVWALVYLAMSKLGKL